MRQAYSLFLNLYPASFRAVFGLEMADVFDLASRDIRQRGIVVWAQFLLTEFTGVIAGAFVQWGLHRRSGPGLGYGPRIAITGIGSVGVALLIQSWAVRLAKPFPHSAVALPEAPTRLHFALLLCMIGFCIVLIAVLSLAFTWNMRTLGNRSGRLKPIWMPGRSANARIAGRNQAVQRSGRRQRRELYRQGR